MTEIGQNLFTAIVVSVAAVAALLAFIVHRSYQHKEIMAGKLLNKRLPGTVDDDEH